MLERLAQEPLGAGRLRRCPPARRRRAAESTAGAYSRLSASIASMPMSPTIGSTSTCARIAVVPAATARSSTRRARAPMSSAVKSRFARPVRRIASAAVSAEPDTRSTRNALSRWIWRLDEARRDEPIRRPRSSRAPARPSDRRRECARRRSRGRPARLDRAAGSREAEGRARPDSMPKSRRRKGRPAPVPHAAVRGRVVHTPRRVPAPQGVQPEQEQRRNHRQRAEREDRRGR